MKRFLTILFLVTVLMMIAICIYAGTLPYGVQSDSRYGLADWTQGWRNASDGTDLSINGERYPAGAQAVTAERTLPDTLPHDPVLYMRSNHNEISCYINGRELFCEGVCRDRAFGITYTGIWVIIPLTETDAGQPLTLQIKKTDGNMGQLPEDMLLGNRNALTNLLMRQSVVPVVIAVFIIAIAFVMFVASLLLRYKESDRVNTAMMWLSLFILMAGVWILTDDNVPALLSGYSDGWYFLSFYSFMLLPVPFARFIGASVPKSKKAMLWLSAGFMLAFLLSVIAAVFFAQPLSLMLPMTHTLIFAGLAAILFYVLRDKDDRGKYRMPELFWGLCLFTVAISGALAAFYFGAIHVYALLFRFAALMFMAVLSYTNIRRALVDINRARQFEQLTQTIPSGISRLNCRDNLSILYGNDTYYRMFGYEPSEAKAAGLTRFDYMLLEEDRERLHQELMDKVKNNQLNFKIEARARHKSGALMYMLTSNNYLPEKGEIVTVLTDITLRKAMEDLSSPQKHVQDEC